MVPIWGDTTSPPPTTDTRFTPAARELGLALQPVGREVYLHWIDQDNAGNLVELQIPLAP